jgi:Flp pilus assembly protein TadD
LNPALNVARFNLAGALREKGDLENAARELRQVAQSSPKWTDARYELGITLARMNDLKGACSQNREAIRQ